MSLVIAWISVDNKQHARKNVSAMYFASDSRISWGEQAKYDYGSKIIYAKNKPEILAYTGRIEFPIQLLSSISNRIDSGVLFDDTDSYEKKSEKILIDIQKHVSEFRPFAVDETWSILYGTLYQKEFALYVYRMRGGEITMERVELPTQSDMAIVIGDPKVKLEFANNLSHYNNEYHSNEAHTSRGVFRCFWETIEKTKAYSVGGVMQIVGMYRGLNEPRIFGIIKDGKRYVCGEETELSDKLLNIEWRDDCFQRIDPRTMQLLEGAQAQPFME